MQVTNKDFYYNSIYSAIVVNSDTNLDPQGNNRIQIYIPSINYNYADVYEEYMNSTDKSSSPHFNKFPWAVSLVKDLKNGNIVYGNFIDNNFNKFIILGLDVNNPANQEATGGDLNVEGIDVLSLAMPIILYHEVSLPFNCWPDNIDTKYFTKITPVDVDGWSIGLIQWHLARAYDCCYYIASNDSGWPDRFVDKTCQLYQDLQKSVSKGSAVQERNNYGTTFRPTPGTALYQSIENLLGSESGKNSQKAYAQEETRNNLTELQGEKYKVNNPAILIFLLDLENQYGSGLPGTKSAASSISSNGKGMMEQFEEFVTYCKNNIATYYEYSDRRETTYNYIVELEKQGKLQQFNLVDLGANKDSPYIPEVGEYLWPLLNSTQINCFWGQNRAPVKYSFKYNAVNNYMGYSGGSFHAGVDFAPAKAGVDGDPVIAVGNGTVAYVGTGYSGGAGNNIIIRMDKNNSHYFSYQHLCQPVTLKVGDRVQAGQVIGYMGTTGNSTGTHLHLGLHLNSTWPPKTTANRIDPLPYLGKTASS